MKKDIFDFAEEANYEKLKSKLRFKNVNQINRSGFNCLHYAVFSCANKEERMKVVRYLLKRGIDINCQDKEENRNALLTLLADFHIKDMGFKLEVTKILLDNGIDIHSQDMYTGDALSYLVMNNNINNDEGKELVRLLIKNKVDYQKKYRGGQTIFEFCSESNKKILKDIIEEELKNDK